MTKRRAKFVLVATAAGVVAAASSASGQSSGASAQDDFGKVFGKHDGRRGPSNPYTQRIDEVAKRPISGGDGASSVLAARFALMGEPLEEDETPPVPPPPPHSNEAVSNSSNAQQGLEGKGAAPAPRGERATRFDQ